MLLSPLSCLPKTYLCEVNGPKLGVKEVEVFRNGATLEDGTITKPGAELELVGPGSSMGTYVYKLVIREGKYHQVKRMFKSVGCLVVKLKRAAFGTCYVEGMEEGEWRELGGEEVMKLMDEVEGRVKVKKEKKEKMKRKRVEEGGGEVGSKK